MNFNYSELLKAVPCVLIMAEHHLSLYFFCEFCYEAALATNDWLIEAIQLKLTIGARNQIGTHWAIIDNNERF